MPNSEVLEAMMKDIAKEMLRISVEDDDQDGDQDGDQDDEDQASLDDVLSGEKLDQAIQKVLEIPGFRDNVEGVVADVVKEAFGENGQCYFYADDHRGDLETIIGDLTG